jgi:hypothetical protein
VYGPHQQKAAAGKWHWKSVPDHQAARTHADVRMRSVRQLTSPHVPR